MAKTTKEFLQNAAQTAKGRNPGRATAEGTAPDAGFVQPFVPDEGSVPEVPEVGAEPLNPMQHDPARPGDPQWELNTVPSAKNQ